ncbi:hypothetical protein SAY87_030826 [Trapa incisa]|uniref:Uncharacterized protein n=1 Tax=Trapa incisa TaxID=236973 RepID=A0AAN7KSD7_9MYRT|nr:hypothetical protein SAY87_030826 [Trapa incisa]
MILLMQWNTFNAVAYVLFVICLSGRKELRAKDAGLPLDLSSRSDRIYPSQVIQMSWQPRSGSSCTRRSFSIHCFKSSSRSKKMKRKDKITWMVDNSEHLCKLAATEFRKGGNIWQS